MPRPVSTIDKANKYLAAHSSRSPPAVMESPSPSYSLPSSSVSPPSSTTLNLTPSFCEKSPVSDYPVSTGHGVTRPYQSESNASAIASVTPDEAQLLARLDKANQDLSMAISPQKMKTAEAVSPRLRAVEQIVLKRLQLSDRSNTGEASLCVSLTYQDLKIYSHADSLILSSHVKTSRSILMLIL